MYLKTAPKQRQEEIRKLTELLTKWRFVGNHIGSLTFCLRFFTPSPRPFLYTYYRGHSFAYDKYPASASLPHYHEAPYAHLT